MDAAGAHTVAETPSALARLLSVGVRTCATSPGQPSATRASGCGLWRESGPVNVVVIGRAENPTATVVSAWRPAQGRWLVAEADLRGVAGCGAWAPSGPQAELRIDAVTRRHVKLVDASCAAPGLRVAIADAHTDVFARSGCAGDRMTDMSEARDALMRSLEATGAGATLIQVRAPAFVPGGCGQMALDDGRVAVIRLP